jgi:hypothetical protein
MGLSGNKAAHTLKTVFSEDDALVVSSGISDEDYYSAMSI